MHVMQIVYLWVLSDCMEEGSGRAFLSSWHNHCWRTLELCHRNRFNCLRMRYMRTRIPSGLQSIMYTCLRILIASRELRVILPIRVERQEHHIFAQWHILPYEKLLQ